MLPSSLTPFLPARINTGPWLAGYSLDVLKKRVATERTVLPICSLGTSPERLAELAPLVLSPLYHEALDADLKSALLTQIGRCFPFFQGTRDRANFRGSFEIVELPREPLPPAGSSPRILAFGVDTTIEQHGPHLPLGTDTVQSYAVLHRLASETAGLAVGPPLDYGHLTWGLPFGLSIDLTPPLVTRYQCAFVNALIDWLTPESLYVVDVHGSIAHRNAIQEGLRRSRCRRWTFRWLHEPLSEYSLDRSDPHAGGVETALVAHINPELVDAGWWPRRAGELVAGQMSMNEAIRLSGELRQFIEQVESRGLNGIVGNVNNAFDLNAEEMMNRMLTVARQDVQELLAR